ncbi:hypothetical protein [Roseibium sp. Sym1]|uniref:hypothetical protein n=1 Tax=Roseibium sp. Sym1 TaxID=3016006 RepID=UPI0022B31C3F|nr:hypothetical protein [Roseibium sp. Sym1]
MRGDSDLSDGVTGRHFGQAPVQAEATAYEKAAVSETPQRTSVKLRLADGSESDCRAGIHLAREADTHFLIFRRLRKGVFLQRFILTNVENELFERNGIFS